MGPLSGTVQPGLFLIEWMCSHSKLLEFTLETQAYVPAFKMKEPSERFINDSSLGERLFVVDAAAIQERLEPRSGKHFGTN